MSHSNNFEIGIRGASNIPTTGLGPNSGAPPSDTYKPLHSPKSKLLSQLVADRAAVMNQYSDKHQNEDIQNQHKEIEMPKMSNNLRYDQFEENSAQQQLQPQQYSGNYAVANSRAPPHQLKQQQQAKNIPDHRYQNNEKNHQQARTGKHQDLNIRGDALQQQINHHTNFNNSVKRDNNVLIEGAGGINSADQSPEKRNQLIRLLSQDSATAYQCQQQQSKLKEYQKMGIQENINQKQHKGKITSANSAVSNINNKNIGQSNTQCDTNNSTKQNSYLVKSFWLLTSIKSKKVQDLVQQRQKNCIICINGGIPTTVGVINEANPQLQSFQGQDSVARNPKNITVGKNISGLRSGSHSNANNSGAAIVSNIGHSEQYYKKLIRQSLDKKYLTSQDYYNSKIVSDIMYNENRHLVSIFKDYLIFDDFSEYLKRPYSFQESVERLPKVFEFYEKYSKVFANYVVLPESKYMFKNIERKQKLIDEKHSIIVKKQQMQQQKQIEEADLAIDSQLAQRMRASKNQIFGSQFINDLTDLEITSQSLLRHQSSKQLLEMEQQFYNSSNNQMMNNFMKNSAVHQQSLKNLQIQQQHHHQQQHKDVNNLEALINGINQFDNYASAARLPYALGGIDERIEPAASMVTNVVLQNVNGGKDGHKYTAGMAAIAPLFQLDISLNSYTNATQPNNLVAEGDDGGMQSFLNDFELDNNQQQIDYDTENMETTQQQQFNQGLPSAGQATQIVKPTGGRGFSDFDNEDDIECMFDNENNMTPKGAKSVFLINKQITNKGEPSINQNNKGISLPKNTFVQNQRPQTQVGQQPQTLSAQVQQQRSKKMGEIVGTGNNRSSVGNGSGNDMIGFSGRISSHTQNRPVTSSSINTNNINLANDSQHFQAKTHSINKVQKLVAHPSSHKATQNQKIQLTDQQWSLLAEMKSKGQLSRKSMTNGMPSAINTPTNTSQIQSGKLMIVQGLGGNNGGVSIGNGTGTSLSQRANYNSNSNRQSQVMSSTNHSKPHQLQINQVVGSSSVSATSNKHKPTGDTTNHPEQASNKKQQHNIDCQQHHHHHHQQQYLPHQNLVSTYQQYEIDSMHDQQFHHLNQQIGTSNMHQFRDQAQSKKHSGTAKSYKERTSESGTSSNVIHLIQVASNPSIMSGDPTSQNNSRPNHDQSVSNSVGGGNYQQQKQLAERRSQGSLQMQGHAMGSQYHNSGSANVCVQDRTINQTIGNNIKQKEIARNNNNVGTVVYDNIKLVSSSSSSFSEQNLLLKSQGYNTQQAHLNMIQNNNLNSLGRQTVVGCQSAKNQSQKAVIDQILRNERQIGLVQQQKNSANTSMTHIQSSQQQQQQVNSIATIQQSQYPNHMKPKSMESLSSGKKIPGNNGQKVQKQNSKQQQSPQRAMTSINLQKKFKNLQLNDGEDNANTGRTGQKSLIDIYRSIDKSMPTSVPLQTPPHKIQQQQQQQQQNSMPISQKIILPPQPHTTKATKNAIIFNQNPTHPKKQTNKQETIQQQQINNIQIQQSYSPTPFTSTNQMLSKFFTIKGGAQQQTKSGVNSNRSPQKKSFQSSSGMPLTNSLKKSFKTAQSTVDVPQTNNMHIDPNNSNNFPKNADRIGGSAQDMFSQYMKGGSSLEERVRQIQEGAIASQVSATDFQDAHYQREIQEQNDARMSKQQQRDSSVGSNDSQLQFAYQAMGKLSSTQNQQATPSSLKKKVLKKVKYDGINSREGLLENSSKMANAQSASFSSLKAGSSGRIQSGQKLPPSRSQETRDRNHSNNSSGNAHQSKKGADGLYIIPEAIYSAKALPRRSGVETVMAMGGGGIGGMGGGSGSVKQHHSGTNLGMASSTINKKRNTSNNSDKSIGNSSVKSGYSSGGASSNNSYNSNPYQKQGGGGITSNGTLKTKPQIRLGSFTGAASATNNNNQGSATSKGNSGLGVGGKLYDKIKSVNTHKKKQATIFTFTK